MLLEWIDDAEEALLDLTPSYEPFPRWLLATDAGLICGVDCVHAVMRTAIAAVGGATVEQANAVLREHLPDYALEVLR
jgi:hypothetical protein